MIFYEFRAANRKGELVFLLRLEEWKIENLDVTQEIMVNFYLARLIVNMETMLQYDNTFTILFEWNNRSRVLSC